VSRPSKGKGTAAAAYFCALRSHFSLMMTCACRASLRFASAASFCLQPCNYYRIRAVTAQSREMPAEHDAHSSQTHTHLRSTTTGCEGRVHAYTRCRGDWTPAYIGPLR
jgi:hypothetical protein